MNLGWIGTGNMGVRMAERLAFAEKMGFSLPLTAIICQYDRFMHFNPKYESYSSFGTIKVLEDMAGKGPGDYDAVKNSSASGEEAFSEDGLRSRLANALGNSLVGITNVLADEALKFCEKAGIESDVALECLKTCHGASRYFKNLPVPNAGFPADNAIKNDMKLVLDTAAEAGIFLPTLAEAHQQLI